MGSSKIDIQYFHIYYYYGEYRVGATRVYHTVIAAADEDSARAEFHIEYKGAHIKNIS